VDGELIEMRSQRRKGRTKGPYCSLDLYTDFPQANKVTKSGRSSINGPQNCVWRPASDSAQTEAGLLEPIMRILDSVVERSLEKISVLFKVASVDER